MCISASPCCIKRVETNVGHDIESPQSGNQFFLAVLYSLQHGSNDSNVAVCCTKQRKVKNLQIRLHAVLVHAIRIMRVLMSIFCHFALILCCLMFLI